MKPGLSATRFAALLLLALADMPAWAAGGVGTVIHLTGTVSVQRADGGMKVLSLDSEVRPEDIVTTEKNSVVRIRFSDGGQLTLRPETRMKIDAYRYEEAAPEQDGMVFSLLRGGLRAITGLVGKRGNRDAYKAKAPQGTIGIRGTRYGMLLCGTDSESRLNNCTGLLSGRQGEAGEPPADGMYVDVTEGAVIVANDGGELLLNVGQSGYVADVKTLPELLVENPGLYKALPSDLARHPGDSSAPGTPGTDMCMVQ